MAQAATRDVFTNELRMITDAIVSAVKPVRIILFGSYARGEQKPDSDYDIYLIVDDDTESTFGVSGDARWALIDVVNKSFDIVTGREKAYDERKHWKGSLEYEIEKEGIVLYDRK